MQKTGKTGFDFSNVGEVLLKAWELDISPVKDLDGLRELAREQAEEEMDLLEEEKGIRLPYETYKNEVEQRAGEIERVLLEEIIYLLKQNL